MKYQVQLILPGSFIQEAKYLYEKIQLYVNELE